MGLLKPTPYSVSKAGEVIFRHNPTKRFEWLPEGENVPTHITAQLQPDGQIHWFKGEDEVSADAAPEWALRELEKHPLAPPAKEGEQVTELCPVCGHVVASAYLKGHLVEHLQRGELPEGVKKAPKVERVEAAAGV